MADAIPHLVSDASRGQRILESLHALVGSNAFHQLLPHLQRLLPACPDPDMALNNLERYLSVARSALPALLEKDAAGLQMLLQLLGTSQFFADVLVADAGAFDMLSVPLRQSPSPTDLVRSLQADVDASYEDSAVLRAIRRFRQRQTLRIGANDIIRDRPLEEITLDLSNVADAVLQVSLGAAIRTMVQRFGRPESEDGRSAKCTLFAFGKLGGRELNYSSDIDVMLIYDEEGVTRGRGAGIGNDEFFGRVAGEIVRLLSSHTDHGQAYRVDLRLRPEGKRGPPARSLASTLSYYDTFGRTWERQALIKLRPVAGDVELGVEFQRSIEPFVYRKYLSFAEINEIKAMKRRIERKTSLAGRAETDVKTGHGGIRDIEFTIQFLQLLNGGDLPAVRQHNTLQGLHALESAGCLTLQEYQLLADAYRFLRRVEHRLQLLFDLQTHRLPDSQSDLNKLALRVGYLPHKPDRNDFRRPQRPRSLLDDAPEETLDTRNLLIDPGDALLHDYRDKTRLNRRILEHLLHTAFVDAHEQAEPETDLLLAAEPDDATIQSVLGRYPFRDVAGAFRVLTALSQESVPFLSTRRCRQFLVSIAPAMLRAVANTPDPDATLRNLELVANSLGAKAVLWELLGVSSASLRLVVEICSGSQFLTEILINNPGMIDELLDSLLQNRPRPISELQTELGELCRGATDHDLILRSFRDKEQLRIGVQDHLGKATIRETTAALSDVAEVMLAQVVLIEEASLQQRLGAPVMPDGSACRFAILALGKLGSRELSYHSDLDLIFVYEDDAATLRQPATAGRQPPSDVMQYFSELGQRLIKTLSTVQPWGRLYQVDMRLRPTGRSGSLAIPLPAFRRYFESASSQLWERQALTRARPVAGDPAFGEIVRLTASQAAFDAPWQPHFVAEILQMRERIEASRGERDLKRGVGGIVDVEFLVQILQLRFGASKPEIRECNTWEALSRLHRAHLLSADDFEALSRGYEFLRLVELRLRAMTNRALDELPENVDDLEKLARRLGFQASDGIQARQYFLNELERRTHLIRACFLRVLDRKLRDAATHAN
jgi:glutamate-ammonia-ligase adenylyltransferase